MSNGKFVNYDETRQIRDNEYVFPLKIIRKIQ